MTTTTETTTEKEPRVYDPVRSLLMQHDGSMNWKPGGGPGGAWVLELHGKTVVVPCRNNHVNALDRLYVASVPDPQTWDDYPKPGRLLPGAFWLLIDLFQTGSRGETR